jgi:hypothetical protein
MDYIEDEIASGNSIMVFFDVSGNKVLRSANAAIKSPK